MTTDDANFAPVNIGQVKVLFGFDPNSFAAKVNAGPDQTISGVTFPAIATLSGSGTGNLTVTWSADSNNPATAQIANVHQLTTTVSIPSIGTYIFYLTVTDGLYTSSASVTITVD